MAYSTPTSTLYNRVRLTRVFSLEEWEANFTWYPHSFTNELMYIKFHDLVCLYGLHPWRCRTGRSGSWYKVSLLVEGWFWDRGAGLDYYPFEPLQVGMITVANEVKFLVTDVLQKERLEAWAQGWVNVLQQNLEDCTIPCMVTVNYLTQQPWSRNNLRLWPLSARRRARAFMLMLGRGRKLQSCPEHDPGDRYAHALPTEVMWNVLGSVDPSWMLLPTRDAPLICGIVGLGDHRRPPCEDEPPSKKRKE